MRKTTNKKTIHPTIFKAINHCTLRANGAIFFLFINISNKSFNGYAAFFAWI